MGRVEASKLLYLIALYMFVGITEAQVKPLFIDCGSNSTSNVDGRTWVGDSASGNNLSLSSFGSVVAISEVNGEPTYGSLYKTARIFNMASNYSFNVSAGGYYIRLHFYPFVSGNISANQSIFEASANKLKLVAKFNVSDMISSKNLYLQNLKSNLTVGSLVKEYFLNISSNDLLIEFNPSPGSFAFINAIEVVPVLDKLFFETASIVGGNGANRSLSFIGGMETMYRLNVGGPEIVSSKDHDLWRKWEQDLIYIFSTYTGTVIKNSSNISYANSNYSSIAPLTVYEEARVTSDANVLDNIFNMSWTFNVDPSFEYLVRLHFCELLYTGIGQRTFQIYIDSKTAASNYDVFAQAGGENKASHEDYVDFISAQTHVLWLQLGPGTSSSTSYTVALLNGLEIFKLDQNGSLAYVPQSMDMGGGALQRNISKHKIVWLIVGVSAITVIVLLGSCSAFFCLCLKKKRPEPAKDCTPRWRPLVLYGTSGSVSNAQENMQTTTCNGAVLANRTGKRFKIMEIRAATKDFDDSLVVGTGGFGKVYKGEIEGGVTVAVKRAHPHSEQGIAEFETEIDMLSKLRHRHLVSLIGYCDEQREMILVYEYMANGTLRSHLFGSDLPPLSWKQRLDACVGAARGLHYLHTGAERGIIHRDVKTTNILLDENFVAKMADFGLSKAGPALDNTHVSTAVKGSFGYLDPEYFRRQKLTQKSDVYSFGVVLFEVICARPVINPTLPKDQINLGEWALKCQRQGALEDIVDPRLEKNYSLESLLEFGEIAEKCLADDGRARPTMGEVLWHLENVLQLHEAYTRALHGDSSARSKIRRVRSSSVTAGLSLIKEEGEDSCREPARLEESSLLSMDSMGKCTYD